jgi:L-aminopeptidase/D-esterase-like protein
MTAYWGKDINELRMLPEMNSLFTAAVEATEEAIVNAMVAGKNQIGADNNRTYAIPHDRLRELFNRQD